MVIGVLSAKNSRYHPNRRLIEAGSKLGHEVVLIDPKPCFPGILDGKLHHLSPLKDLKLDVVLPRMGATIKEYSTTLIRHFELMSIPVINGFFSVLLAKSKFMSLQVLVGKGVPVPDSYLISNYKNLQSAVAMLGGYPVVAKTLNSRQGSGVTVIDSPLTGEFVIDNLQEKGQGLLLQEYFNPKNRQDIRVFVIDKRVIASMSLKPRKGDFRANIHLGSRGTHAKIPKEYEKIAINSAKALGLQIAGVDMIVDSKGKAKVLEVNYSPGFRGLEAATGLDIASEILRFVTKL